MAVLVVLIHVLVAVVDLAGVVRHYLNYNVGIGDI